MGSEACPRSFHLPYPGYPGMVLALRQGWGELIRATPLRLWFTRFDSSERVTLVPIHWEDEGLGPFTSQAPGRSNNPLFSHQQFCLAEGTFPTCA